MDIELRVGDIASQPDLAAVVNAANAQLMPGGGVAGAIHRAAGPELAEACKPLAPIEPGQAVITSAFSLPNDWIIHVLGPRYGIDEPSEDLLVQSYRGALRLCDQHDIDSVGFPLISSGAFGYPMPDAARVAVRTVGDFDPDCRVCFVLFDEATAEQVRPLV